MAPPEAKQKLTAFVGYAHLLGDDHSPSHYRWSWWPIANAAIVVLVLSFAFANSGLADEREDVAFRYYRLGEESHAKGQFRKAIGYYEKALAINREALGERHPNIAGSYNNLGLAWKNLGQYKKAIGYYEKALAIIRVAFPKGHPLIRTTERNLAAAKRQQRR